MSKPLLVDHHRGLCGSGAHGGPAAQALGFHGEPRPGIRRRQAPEGPRGPEPLAIHGGLNVTLKPRDSAQRLTRASPRRLPYNLNFVVVC